MPQFVLYIRQLGIEFVLLRGLGRVQEFVGHSSASVEAFVLSEAQVSPGHKKGVDRFLSTLQRP